MRPYAESIVTLRAQLRAFHASVDRFEIATSRRDAGAAYASVAEALNHAVSIDDRIARIWQPGGIQLPDRFWFERVPGAAVAPGVRWVRDLVHHQWADALELDLRSHGRFPPQDREWVWLERARLPGRPRTHSRKARRSGERDLVAAGYAAYGTYMSGRPADFTLHILGEAFDFVAALVEPVPALSRAA